MSRSSSTREPLTLQVAVEKWPLRAPFHITGYTMTDLDAVVVTLGRNGHVGRGEAAGVYYLNDDAVSIVRRIEAVRSSIEAGIDRESLQRLLPAGGARNAIDCALWDLDAKCAGRPAWTLAGLDASKPLLTAHTIGAGTPEDMAAGARVYAKAKLLKLKLTGESLDAARIRAVRAERPDVSLAVDANQGFTPASLQSLMPALSAARVILIEQPFPRGQDYLLDEVNIPIPIAADESAQSLSDIPQLVGRFDVVNIKLDKCGGLTEALAMAQAALQNGLDVMVGNMMGTALAMAPAFLLGQLCKMVDLDGPLFLRSDRSPGLTYEDGHVWCPQSVWGDVECA